MSQAAAIQKDGNRSNPYPDKKPKKDSKSKSNPVGKTSTKATDQVPKGTVLVTVSWENQNQKLVFHRAINDSRVPKDAWVVSERGLFEAYALHAIDPMSGYRREQRKKQVSDRIISDGLLTEDGHYVHVGKFMEKIPTGPSGKESLIADLLARAKGQKTKSGKSQGTPTDQGKAATAEPPPNSTRAKEWGTDPLLPREKRLVFIKRLQKEIIDEDFAKVVAAIDAQHALNVAKNETSKRRQNPAKPDTVTITMARLKEYFSQDHRITGVLEQEEIIRQLEDIYDSETRETEPKSSYYNVGGAFDKEQTASKWRSQNVRSLAEAITNNLIEGEGEWEEEEGIPGLPGQGALYETTPPIGTTGPVITTGPVAGGDKGNLITA